MDQQGVDKLLKRRLYLQRYVTSLFNDVSDINAQGDRKLLRLIREFIEDADEKALAALSKRRTSNADAAAVLAGMISIIATQRDDVNEHVAEQMKDLVEREGVVTAEAMGAKPPSMRGVSNWPVDGNDQSALLIAAYGLFATRLLSTVVRSAMEPDGIIRLIRGTKTQQYNNGLIGWRNSLLIRPNIDLIVNGNASNAAARVYEAEKVQMVNFLSTLDYRRCISCAVAELNSPYKLGRQPTIPQHNFCRCVLTPATDVDVERGFVKDFRPVKDIPKNERAGIIGTTKDDTDKFIDRMSEQDRRRWMGPARAKLWREGKVTDIRQLVNEVTLEPLTLDQLPQ